MSRHHNTFENDSSPKIIGPGGSPHRFWPLKATLTMLFAMSAAVGLVLAAVVLGSIIAGVLLILAAIAIVVFSIKRFFSPRRRIEPRY